MNGIEIIGGGRSIITGNRVISPEEARQFRFALQVRNTTPYLGSTDFAKAHGVFPDQWKQILTGQEP